MWIEFDHVTVNICYAPMPGSSEQMSNSSIFRSVVQEITRQHLPSEQR